MNPYEVIGMTMAIGSVLAVCLAAAWDRLCRGPRFDTPLPDVASRQQIADWEHDESVTGRAVVPLGWDSEHCERCRKHNQQAELAAKVDLSPVRDWDRCHYYGSHNDCDCETTADLPDGLTTQQRHNRRDRRRTVSLGPSA